MNTPKSEKGRMKGKLWIHAQTISWIISKKQAGTKAYASLKTFLTRRLRGGVFQIIPSNNQIRHYKWNIDYLGSKQSIIDYFNVHINIPKIPTL